MHIPPLAELAEMLGTTPEYLRNLLERVLVRLPQQHYYVFRFSNPDPAARLASDQCRTITAFVSPDDALSFAQRNGYGSNVRLRSITAAELVLRLLADASTEEICVERSGLEEDVHSYKPVICLKRSDLLSQLQIHQPIAIDTPITLTAAFYDKLQFGVDFMRRAEFRAALAQAVEQVVASYTPPPGSLDRGPRSIFAATIVELWLRQNGFPHARQRRWISVADDPVWGGAVELYEIEGGTINRLLIQLVIHVDEADRQYIKWVNVTT